VSGLFPAGADAFVARAAGSPGRLPALASELVAAGVRTILAVARGPRHDVLTIVFPKPRRRRR